VACLAARVCHRDAVSEFQSRVPAMGCGSAVGCNRLRRAAGFAKISHMHDLEPRSPDMALNRRGSRRPLQNAAPY